MKKILVSILASISVLFTFSLPTTTVIAADFISIGTGGPTGVYFVVGNSVCRMVHKEAAEGLKKGRKHGIRCSAPSTGGSNYNIGQIKFSKLFSNSRLPLTDYSNMGKNYMIPFWETTAGIIYKYALYLSARYLLVPIQFLQQPNTLRTS